MTKSSAAVIALLCLFTLSTAQTTPETDDATTRHSEFSLALRLPSETDTSTAVQTTLPLTKPAFHLVNHRFPARSKKPCRHHVKVLPTMRENEMIPYGNDMLVASGENSDFVNPKIHGEEPSVRMHRHHHQHHHHHHHEDSDSDSDSDDEEEEKKEEKRTIVFKRYGFDRYGEQDQESKVLKKMKKMNEMEGNRKKKGCFFRRLRKFLDHYF